MGIRSTHPWPRMTTQARYPKQPNVTERLWSLFDQVGVEALPLNFAQAAGAV